MKRLFVFFVIGVFLSGCATAGSPKVKDQNLLAKISKGVTTQDEILAMYGKPQVKKTKENGLEVWEYHYVQTEVTAVTFVPVVGLFAGGANSKVDGIEVEFNADKVVNNYTTSTGSVKSQNFGNTETDIQKTEH